MKKYRLQIITAVFLITAASARNSSTALNGRGLHSLGMQGAIMQRVLHTPIDYLWNQVMYELRLQGEQRDRLSETAGNYSFQNMGLRSELGMNMRELEDELARTDINAHRAETLIDSITHLQGGIYKNRIRALSDAQEILDDSQWRRVKSLFSQGMHVPR